MYRARRAIRPGPSVVIAHVVEGDGGVASRRLCAPPIFCVPQMCISVYQCVCVCVDLVARGARVIRRSIYSDRPCPRLVSLYPSPPTHPLLPPQHPSPLSTSSPSISLIHHGG